MTPWDSFIHLALADSQIHAWPGKRPLRARKGALDIGADVASGPDWELSLLQRLGAPT